jgi:hypothetical protein
VLAYLEWFFIGIGGSGDDSFCARHYKHFRVLHPRHGRGGSAVRKPRGRGLA